MATRTEGQLRYISAYIRWGSPWDYCILERFVYPFESILHLSLPCIHLVLSQTRVERKEGLVLCPSAARDHVITLRESVLFCIMYWNYIFVRRVRKESYAFKGRRGRFPLVPVRCERRSCYFNARVIKGSEFYSVLCVATIILFGKRGRKVWINCCRGRFSSVPVSCERSCYFSARGIKSQFYSVICMTSIILFGERGGSYYKTLQYTPIWPGFRRSCEQFPEVASWPRW